MILQVDDWKFEIDMEHTMAYSSSEAAEHCDCAYCRNFYAAVDGEAPGLRSFLAQFGLDIEAPDVLYPYDIHQQMYYEGEYVAFGKILQFGKDRIVVDNAYIYPMAESTHQHAQSYFVLSLEELFIPWVLDEPLQEVISTANEPSFIKRMWERLLSRGKKTKSQ